MWSKGLPNDFVFNGIAVSNMYRHIGDAVHPLISYQLAHLCHWILAGEQPVPRSLPLENTSLRPDDIVRKGQQELFYGRARSLRNAS